MVIGTIAYDNLVLETYVTEGATLLSGQNLTKGAVLGRISASGKLKLADGASVDGSQTPFAILLEDCDATAGDKGCPILLSGVVNEDELVFGGTLTASGVKSTLRDAGIFLKTVIGA